MASPQPVLLPEDEWISKVDMEGFREEISNLGKELQAKQGEADIEHLHKILRWSNLCAAVGLLTLWTAPNPLTVFALSMWTCSRWTMVAHHVCHGGYDNADKEKYYNRRTFAVGSVFKRVVDWFDWFLPEAWNVEHNNMHHYSLGESSDPDLLENNVEDLRSSPSPLWQKYMQVFLMMLTWKWFYYAPNTYKEYKLAQLRKNGEKPPEALSHKDAVTLLHVYARPNAPLRELYGPREFTVRVLGPYLLLHFVLLPAPFLLLSTRYFWNAVINLVLAELLTNLHAFIIIVPNHAGDDMYRFEHGVKPKSASFFLRQVVSSVNFTTGTDVNDFLHGWLNYQIEHHLWPNLSMLSYQRSQPLVKAICRKHGIPYVQQSVFRRLHKTVQIMVGTASMRRFPAHLDVYEDLSNTAREAVQK